MRNDLLYAFRSFGRTPGFTLVALLALSLGIGANTAIFSVVNAVLLKALPYQDPARLVYLWGSNPSLKLGIDDLPISVGELFDYRERSKTLERITMIGSGRSRVGLGADAEMVDGSRVTGDFFALFGVPPVLGQTFGQAEDQPGREKVVVLSNGLWQRRFGGNREALGQTLHVDGKPYRIVGVMPPQFTYPHSAEVPKEYGFGPSTDLWTPMQISYEERRDRGNRSYVTLARLRHGVSIQQARAEADTINAALQNEYPEAGMGWSVRLHSFEQQISGKVRPILLVLLWAVGILLLIACANVANLLLARATARQKEIAVRVAMGAGRGRVIRQLLTESIVLSLAGGLAALAIGWYAVKALVQLSPGGIPRLQEAALDWRVFLFTLALSLVTGAVFGMAPAITASKADLASTLKQSSRAIAGGGHRLRSALVIGEVALAVMLLAGAGLLIRSFANLLQVDPGFKQGPAVTMRIAVDSQTPRDRVRSYYEEVVRQVSALPNVESAGVVNEMPLGGGEQMQILEVEGRPKPKPREAPLSESRVATPGYFPAMGIRLISGRYLEPGDTDGKLPVAVVNEKLARDLFPGESPIGRRIRNFQMSAGPNEEPWISIVGVVANTRHAGLDFEPRGQFYRAHAQQPRREMGLIVRLQGGDANAAAAGIRSTVRNVDPAQMIDRVTTLDTMISDSVARRRYNMLLLGAFAALALLMTIVGLFGVLSYSVTQRTSEMGVRIALGATSGDVQRQVIGEGMKLAGIGAAIGVAGALGLSRLLTSLLFGVTPYDPVTLAGVVAVLMTVAALACWVPARRASRMDPMAALRAD